jgi:hypothetical protein
MPRSQLRWALQVGPLCELPIIANLRTMSINFRNGARRSSSRVVGWERHYRERFLISRRACCGIRTFSPSFVRIKAADIREEVRSAYRGGRFWPAWLVQLNRNFLPAGTIDDLVPQQILEPECARIFRI